MSGAAERALALAELLYLTAPVRGPAAAAQARSAASFKHDDRAGGLSPGRLAEQDGDPGCRPPCGR
jgi:hypothetical protein